MTDATRRAALAERAARAGGIVAKETFREALTVETKTDKNDLVTAADRDAQQQVVATIQREFPDDALVCEEDVTAPGVDDVEIRKQVPETGPAWVVDPIDGTANYVRGIRFWGTSIAAVVDGEPVGVATYLPAERDIYTAGPESVTCHDSAMSVSDRSDPETFATALVARWFPERSEALGAVVRGINDAFGDPRRFGSFQASLAFVASGELDAAVTAEPVTPWDTIAGVHLVERAGGTVTDIHGEPWSLEGEGLIASNGEVHDELVETVEAAVGTTVA